LDLLITQDIFLKDYFTLPEYFEEYTQVFEQEVTSQEFQQLMDQSFLMKDTWVSH
jgi:hypothetical protein